MAIKNSDVADLLQRIGDLMELSGEQAFKARAYREAARQIDLVDEDVATLVEEGRLTTIKGIGQSIARTIEEYVRTGKSKQLERLRAAVPESLVELLGLRHFGPSRIHRVHQALGVTGLDELEAAVRSGRIEALPGFGRKSVEALLASIEGFRQRRGRIPRYIAEAIANNVVHSLRQMAGTDQVAVAGSVRRLADTVANVDIVAAADTPDEMVEAFARLSTLRDVERTGRCLAEARTREQHAVRLYVVPPFLLGQGLRLFTGSRRHNEQLHDRARALGLGVQGSTARPPGEGIETTRPGFILEADGTPVAARAEGEVYARLGLPYLPPELREGRGEIEAALAGTLPRLIETSDVKGDLHVHTTWSDGRNTIAEMARRARALGYSYLAISDHSQSLGVARGLSLERLAEQQREIAAVDQALDRFQLLSSVELDIKRDGTLDYPDEVLARFDFVTASLHSGFQQSREQLTKRVIAAMESPHVDAIGHLTGRVLGWRDPLDVDVEAVLAAAAETGTAIEINAWPNRLDIDEHHARRAKELGVKLVINTDSHAEDQLEYLRYGVEIARRAWLEPGDVLNALAWDELRAYLRARPRKA